MESKAETAQNKEEVTIPAPEYKKTEIPEEFRTTEITLKGLIEIDVPRFGEEFQRLIKVEDPRTNPYKSRYLACDMLNVLKSKFEEILSNSTNEDEKNDAEQEIGQIDCLVGLIEIDTDELSNGEKHIMNGISILVKRFPFSSLFVLFLLISLLDTHAMR